MPMPVPGGLHAPVTNLAESTATIAGEMISAGDIGFGELFDLPPGAAEESFPVARELARPEAQLEFSVPDTSDLRDIGEASFGPPAADLRAITESVLGTDERVRVQNTTQIPWRLNASLLITAADNSQWIGTGWFISPRTLVTAGHVVHIKNSGRPGRDGFVKKIQVIPGRNGSQMPFGALTSTEFFTVRGWADSGLENFDYGAIVLSASFPQNLGFFSFGTFDDATLLAATANISGYPGDKPTGTQWFDKRRVSSVKPEKVFYAADTAGGQSGACVYLIRNGERIGIAVHAYGGTTANSGTRISNEVFANLTNWKR